MFDSGWYTTGFLLGEDVFWKIDFGRIVSKCSICVEVDAGEKGC